MISIFFLVEYAVPQISALLSPSSETSVEYLSSESILENSSTESIQNDLNSENAIPQISILLNTAPNITEEQQTSSSDNNETASSNLPISSLLNAQNTNSPLPPLDLNTELPHFPYIDLTRCTLNFNENMFDAGRLNYDSRKLGSGAFGTVYLGIGLMKINVAVKKLHLNGIEVVSEDDTVTRQFVSEVEILYRYRHENLLSLLGYSCDGPTYCLIYEYISGGVLGDRIVVSLGRNHIEGILCFSLFWDRDQKNVMVCHNRAEGVRVNVTQHFLATQNLELPKFIRFC